MELKGKQPMTETERTALALEVLKVSYADNELYKIARTILMEALNKGKKTASSK